MSELNYEEKTVRVLDALAKEEDVSDDNQQKFVQTLHLLLQEVQTMRVFETILFESDVRKIIRRNEPLNSKQMIDLAIALRSREEPLKLVVPVDSMELSADDIIESRKLDPPKPKNKNRRYYKNKNKRYQNNKQKQTVN
jgi:hypothetical protein